MQPPERSGGPEPLKAQAEVTCRSPCVCWSEHITMRPQWQGAPRSGSTRDRGTPWRQGSAAGGQGSMWEVGGAPGGQGAPGQGAPGGQGSTRGRGAPRSGEHPGDGESQVLEGRNRNSLLKRQLYLDGLTASLTFSLLPQALLS